MKIRSIQTERLENHTARLTVEVEPGVWEKAKRQAARQISRRYNIPGFRKGKAPYGIVVKYFGEAAIIEDALEIITNDIYRDALQQAEVDPYAAGELEDFRLEPVPTYVFTLPLMPEVDLGEYRSVRLDYEEPAVTDEEVEEALQQLREREAESEEIEGPVAIGHRVLVDIHSEFVTGELPEELADEADESDEVDDEEDEASASVDEADDEAEADESEADEADDDEEWTPTIGESYIHEHDASFILDPEEEPLVPGFTEALVATGATAGSTVDFELHLPEDSERFGNAAGHTVLFEVTVEKIESITLPELNDEFAAYIARKEAGEITDDEPLDDMDDDEEDEEEAFEDVSADDSAEDAADDANEPVDPAEDTPAEADPSETVASADVEDAEAAQDDEASETSGESQPMTLDQLRERLREQLQKEAVDSYREQYVDDMLAEIVRQATISYPEKMVDARLEEMLEKMDGTLRNQGIPLEDYLRMIGTEREDFKEQYRETAEDWVRRMLVQGELIQTERLHITEEEIQERIDEMLSQFGEHREMARQFLDTPVQRDRLAGAIVFERFADRLAQIGRGEELPDLSDEADDEADETSEETDTAADTLDEAEGAAEALTQSAAATAEDAAETAAEAVSDAVDAVEEAVDSIRGEADEAAEETAEEEETVQNDQSNK